MIYLPLFSLFENQSFVLEISTFDVKAFRPDHLKSLGRRVNQSS